MYQPLSHGGLTWYMIRCSILGVLKEKPDWALYDLGITLFIYCNYWGSSFLLPLTWAPVPDGRKARALFPCAAVCLHFLLVKAQFFLGTACRDHTGLLGYGVLLPYTVRPRHSLEDFRLCSVGMWAQHLPEWVRSNRVPDGTKNAGANISLFPTRFSFFFFGWMRLPHLCVYAVCFDFFLRKEEVFPCVLFMVNIKIHRGALQWFRLGTWE